MDTQPEPFDAVMEDLQRVMRRADSLGFTMVAALGEFHPHRGDNIDRDHWDYTFCGPSFAGIGVAALLHKRLLDGPQGEEE